MIQNKKNGCRCHKISLDMNNMIIGTHSTYSVLYISCVQCLHHTLLHFSCKLLRSVHTDNVSADADTRTFTVKRCKQLVSSLGLLGMVKELQVQTYGQDMCKKKQIPATCIILYHLNPQFLFLYLHLIMHFSLK